MKQEQETRRLIDLLMSGDITPAEQRQLQTLLSAPDLAPEFAIYRDMMAWMDRPLPTPTAEELQAMTKAETPRHPLRRWAIAASIAVIFCLGVAAATIYHFAPKEAATEEAQGSEVVTTEAPAPKPEFFVFDNVEMEQVAATLGKHFRLTPVFENEAAKHKRLYFRAEKSRTIQEIAELISNISDITVTVRDGKLIIK